MQEKKTLRTRTIYMSKIVLPILVTQVALYLMTFFDILMTSKYHIDHLAGVSIGSSIWVPVYTGLTGILLGITPIVAQLIGAKKEQDVRAYIQQGFYIAFLLAFVVFIGIFSLVDSLLIKMPLEISVRSVAKNYLYMMAIGLVPYMVGVNVSTGTPILLSAFAAWADWRGILLQAILIAVSTAIYYPFFRAVDNQALKEEAAAE